jgi:hypothetical protein
MRSTSLPATSILNVGLDPLIRYYFWVSTLRYSVAFFAAGVFMDLRALRHPVEITWNQPGNGWLIDVYDWDVVIVKGQVTFSTVLFTLNLCVGLFPCSMWVRGSPVGVIQGRGQISCLSSNGCESLGLENINLVCVYHGIQQPTSTFKVRGSNLTILNSAFTGCVSGEDGGVIQSFDRSMVLINSSNFHHSYSAGYGGAIAAHGGSLRVVNSSFTNSSAARGGGALWSTAFQGEYGLSQHHDTILEIRASIFRKCTANGGGGAILVSSEASLAESGKNNLDVKFYGSKFYDNVATDVGGAISAGFSSIVLVGSVLNNNKALGFGGGAIFLKESLIFVNGTSCAGNKAPGGGGGLLLSEGSKLLAPDVAVSLCEPNQNNEAVYGPCIASDFKSINLIYNSSVSRWAGIPTKFVAEKLDAYGQIILNDFSFAKILPSTSSTIATEDLNPSFSFVGSSVSQFVRGTAIFEVAIQPIFAEISTNAGVASLQAQPNIFVQNSDPFTGAIMKSSVASIILEEGKNVCDEGYILDFDSNMAGVCKPCPRETYILSPLSTIQGAASCITCPAQAVCPDGSCIFHYKGIWVIDMARKQFILEGCPAGYYLSSQQQECNPCPAAFYCTGVNNPPEPCRSNSFTPPKAKSLESCVLSEFVSIAVNLPIKRPEFNENRNLQFQTIIANLTKRDPGYVVIKVVQSGIDPQTTTVTSEIAVSNAQEAKALVESVNSSVLSVVLASDGGYDHRVEVIFEQVSSCVPGYELNLTSKTCQLCRASYF